MAETATLATRMRHFFNRKATIRQASQLQTDQDKKQPAVVCNPSIGTAVVIASQTIPAGDAMQSPSSRRDQQHQCPAPPLSTQQTHKPRQLPCQAPQRVEFLNRPSGDLGNRIEAKYQLLQALGTGVSGTVYLVRSRTADVATSTCPTFACKHFTYQDSDITRNDHTSAGIKQDAMNELQVMRALHHPNLLRLVDAFVGNTSCFLVTELARGGDLQRELKKRRRFDEEDAKAAIAGVLSGLAYLHGKGMAHRDLKLENILLTGTTRDDLSAAKIADFAMSKNLQGLATSEHTICGTPLTMAPEVLVPSSRSESADERSLSRYGVKADVWSCGVILYCLLSGVPPYKCARGGGRTGLKELFTHIVSAEIEFSHPGWWGVSAQAKDLVSKLLVRSPEKRLTAEEALRHPWLTSRSAAIPSSSLQ